MSDTEPRRLDRATLQRPAAPIRIVHLGVGEFHRAHQAWYTAHATDAAEWGILGFTGRSPRLADALTPQDGLYTLVERGPERDSFEVVDSISRVVSGADVGAFVDAVADPATAVVTLTVTEPGYQLDTDESPRDPHTAMGRLALGLNARRVAGSGPLAIVPCDNLPDNGGAVRHALLSLAEGIDPALATWLEREVSFVSTSIDRITPRPGPTLAQLVAEQTGMVDQAPVVTEPFSSWVMAGKFPAGRPDWGSAGAEFTDDIRPFEQRKLLLLNGAHSILAYSGLLRGRVTVFDAISDPECRRLVEAFWDEAAVFLPAGLGVADYRAALLTRWSNPRIAHQLSQIAEDGLAKLRVRIAPVALQTLQAGRQPTGCAAAIASWIAATLDKLTPRDAGESEIARATSERQPVRALLALVSPELAAAEPFAADVDAHVAVFRGTSIGARLSLPTIDRGREPRT